MRLLAIVAMAVTLVGAACLPRQGTGPSSAPAGPLGITVEGEGRVEARPDHVEVRFSLLGQGLTAEEARGRTNDSRDALLKKLSELGIAPWEVVSVQLNVHQGPNAPATPMPTPTPSQWRAFQTVSITVALAPKGQELAAELVSAGVTGVRSLTYRDDLVAAYFDLDALGESTARAQEDTSRKADSIKKALTARGLKVIEMKVTGAGASPFPPLQDFSQPGVPTFVAWQTFRVSTGRLDLLPAIAAAVAPLGRIETLTFGISDPGPLIARGREAALADAQKKAEDIASRTGTRVGKVINVSEDYSRMPAGIGTPTAPSLAVSMAPPRSLLDQPSDTMAVRLKVTYSFK